MGCCNFNTQLYVKSIAKQLFITQVRHRGIPKSVINTLPKEIQRFLTKADTTGRLKCSSVKRIGKYQTKSKTTRYVLKPELRDILKVVMTGGVFDVLHYGHVYTLNKAKAYGDVLVAVVACDDNVKKWKGKRPLHSQEYRRMIVEQLKPVDIAIIGCRYRMETFKRIDPDIVVFGYDQKPFLKSRAGLTVVKLKRPVNDSMFKSSKIKEHIGI